MARREGVTIKVTPSGEHVATSASDATRAYVVSVEAGCQCRGYQFWSRCQHYALLLSELGVLDTGADDAADTYEVSDLPGAMVSNVRASLECGMSPRHELIDDAADVVACYLASLETGVDELQARFISRFVSRHTPAERQALLTYREARQRLQDTGRRLVEQIAGGVTAPTRYDVLIAEETRHVA